MKELIEWKLYWYGYLTKKIFVPTHVRMDRGRVGFIAYGLFLDIGTGMVTEARNILIYNVNEITEQERIRLLRNTRRRGFSEEALNILRKRKKKIVNK